MFVSFSAVMKMEVRTQWLNHSQTNIHWQSLSFTLTPLHPHRPSNQILPSPMFQNHWPWSLALASVPLRTDWLLPAPHLHSHNTPRPYKSEWIWKCLCWEDKTLSSSCRRNITPWKLRWWKSKWKSQFHKTEIISALENINIFRD